MPLEPKVYLPVLSGQRNLLDISERPSMNCFSAEWSELNWVFGRQTKIDEKAIWTRCYRIPILKCIAVAIAALAPAGSKGATIDAASAVYTREVVNVSCTGFGSTLQNTLDSLNPLSHAYEVRIRGKCPENLRIDRFRDLRLTSSNLNDRAAIGKVFVTGEAKNVYLESLDISSLGWARGVFLPLFPLTEENVEGFEITAFNSFLEISDVQVICEPEFRDALCVGIFKSEGILEVSKLEFSGGIWALKALIMVSSKGYLYPDATLYTYPNQSGCLPFDSIYLHGFTNSAEILQGRNCATLDLRVGFQSEVDLKLNEGSTASVGLGPYSKIKVTDLAWELGISDVPRTTEQMINIPVCGRGVVVVGHDQYSCP